MLLSCIICNFFPCYKFSCKTSNGLPKHVHFRPVADDPTHAKIPLSFLEFDINSTYMAGLDPSDGLLYQITVPISTEPELKSNDACPWSE